MSSLKYHQKKTLESILQMGGGYVLDLSDREFSEFFRDFGVNIYDDKYLSHGPSDSKANCLRAFWELESDELVGRILHALLDLIESFKMSYAIEQMERARQIANSLNNSSIPTHSGFDDSEAIKFLEKSFEADSIGTSILTSHMSAVLNRRLKETLKCLQTGAFLASVIMAGSLLEGLLFELANKQIIKFNQSSCSPKNREGDVKKIYEWTLAELINVAHDTEFISIDVKKFSSTLREFRNYIHPQEQMKFNFHPDKHTAAMAIQVLKAAIADISNERTFTKLLNTATPEKSVQQKDAYSESAE